MPQFDEKEQEKKLELLHKQEEEELAQTLSEKYGLEYRDLTGSAINNDALRLVTEAEAREALIAPFNRVGKKIAVALKSPQKDETRALIARLEDRGYIVTRYMVSMQSLEHAWSRFSDISRAVETKAGVLDISGEEIQKAIRELKTLGDTRKQIEETLKAKKAYRISSILEVVLGGALANNASDVHIEPEEDHVRLRYRLDGVLTDILQFDRETYHLILSRVKLLSGLKLNVKTVSQDGRFSIHVGEKDIEIRTSVLPGAYGEPIVMRLLDPSTIALGMEELGINPHILPSIENAIGKPNGIILNTGPTGSGKTTTLYAFLKKIHTPDIKIVTIEDPIEYHLTGIVQTQVSSSYAFVDGLRSILRQDPDVIMIGEIREPDVAQTAVEASLTGHLVFTTLHTNTAAGTFPRLNDLGADATALSSSVNMVMAQRLVRRLKPDCRREVPLEGKTKERVMRVLDSITDKTFVPKQINTIWEPAAGTMGSPCEIPYAGRVGLFEILIMNDEIRTLIESRAGEKEIAKAAREHGMLTMEQDGILKVLAGVTSLAEVERVLDLGALDQAPGKEKNEETEDL